MSIAVGRGALTCSRRHQEAAATMRSGLRQEEAEAGWRFRSRTSAERGSAISSLIVVKNRGVVDAGRVIRLSFERLGQVERAFPGLVPPEKRDGEVVQRFFGSGLERQDILERLFRGVELVGPEVRFAPEQPSGGVVGIAIEIGGQLRDAGGEVVQIQQRGSKIETRFDETGIQLNRLLIRVGGLLDLSGPVIGQAKMIPRFGPIQFRDFVGRLLQLLDGLLMFPISGKLIATN